ncbi:MAG: ABC transporter permease [Aerococcaceae bacterium]|nr:ABC transporter permease [Aerococcaceae bacterium]
MKKHSLISVVSGILLWELAGHLKWLPPFVLPVPSQIIVALGKDWQNLLFHSQVTLVQALAGLLIGVGIAFVLAIWMDCWRLVHAALYPLLIISQTIPTVAIAPILVLALGYEMTPKIVLVALTTLFPVVMSILSGFAQCDQEAIDLLRLMGASKRQILWHVKLPFSLPYFFAGLKVSVSYAFVGSVVAEWLGGFQGLGVYMIQTKRAFAYDKMFAVILVISVISLLGMSGVSLIERLALPWQLKRKEDKQ